MMELFKIAARRHDEIVKTAIVGAIAGTTAKAGLGLAKSVIKSPMKWMGIGFGAADVMAGAKSGVENARRMKFNAPPTMGATY